VAQVVEHLLSKCEALSSNHNPTTKNKELTRWVLPPLFYLRNQDQEVKKLAQDHKTKEQNAICLFQSPAVNFHDR
jgi:hypothetical protein